MDHGNGSLQKLFHAMLYKKGLAPLNIDVFHAGQASHGARLDRATIHPHNLNPLFTV
jgi:hypothetical protein